MSNLEEDFSTMNFQKMVLASTRGWAPVENKERQYEKINFATLIPNDLKKGNYILTHILFDSKLFRLNQKLFYFIF